MFSLRHARRQTVSTLRRATIARPNSSKSSTTPLPPPPASSLFGVGVLGGAAGSLVGLGGGFVIIPALVGLKLTQHQAHATSLAAVCATGIAGAATFWADGYVDMRSAGILAGPALLTVSLGATFSSRLNSTKLKLLMGVFMMSVAPLVPMRKPFIEWVESRKLPGEASPDTDKNTGDESEMSSANDLAMLVVGSITGFCSGLFGVGGGSIMTPGIALFTDLGQHAVIGTSLAAMVLPSIVGVGQHYRLGFVNPATAVPLSIGAAVGAFSGGKVALGISEEPLKWVFAFLMMTLGFKQARTASRTLQNAKKSFAG